MDTLMKPFIAIYHVVSKILSFPSKIIKKDNNQKTTFFNNNINILHLPNIATQYDFKVFAPNPYDYVTYIDLPLVENHKDPFDRMLIHSAIKNNLILLSKDSYFERYKDFGLQLLW